RELARLVRRLHGGGAGRRTVAAMNEDGHATLSRMCRESALHAPVGHQPDQRRDHEKHHADPRAELPCGEDSRDVQHWGDLAFESLATASARTESGPWRRMIHVCRIKYAKAQKSRLRP